MEEKKQCTQDAATDSSLPAAYRKHVQSVCAAGTHKGDTLHACGSGEFPGKAPTGGGDTDDPWETKYGLLKDSIPLKEKLSIIAGASSQDAVKSPWARRCIVDAGCHRLGVGHEEGNELGKAAGDALYHALYKYVYDMIYRMAGNYVTTPDRRQNDDSLNGMMNTAFLEVFKSLHSYDPMRSTFTTFFKKRIISGITKWIEQEYRDSSPSVSGRASHVRKVMRKLRDEGKEVTPETIHACIPRYSIAQISNLLEVLNGTESRSMLEDVKGTPVRSHVPGPEEQYLEKERNRMFYDAVESLPEAYRKVYCMAYGIDLEEREINGVEEKTIDISRATGFTPEEIGRMKKAANESIISAMSSDGTRRIRRTSKINVGIKIPFLDDTQNDAVDEFMDSVVAITRIHGEEWEDQGGGAANAGNTGTGSIT